MPVTILNSRRFRKYGAKAAPLQRAARAALKSEGAAGAEVSVLLTDDATIHALNRDYRGYDKPTDVLSFAQRDQHPDTPVVPPNVQEAAVGGEPLAELLGDVVISVETAARQAEQHGVTLEQELALLTVHGVLHLLGYDDQTEAGAAEMQAKERALGVRELQYGSG